VHSGGSNAGHYYAFIRPDVLSNKWVVCNDSMYADATEAEVKKAYGGDLIFNGKTFPDTSNAYMLTYVRKSDACECQFSAVPRHVSEDFTATSAREKAEKAQAEIQRRWRLRWKQKLSSSV
jgi:ubiquitin carboxyl-terminal hydrolase 7